MADYRPPCRCHRADHRAVDRAARLAAAVPPAWLLAAWAVVGAVALLLLTR